MFFGTKRFRKGVEWYVRIWILEKKFQWKNKIFIFDIFALIKKVALNAPVEPFPDHFKPYPGFESPKSKPKNGKKALMIAVIS